MRANGMLGTKAHSVPWEAGFAELHRQPVLNPAPVS